MRPIKFRGRDTESGEFVYAELILAKNRNGPTASIRLYFEKEITRFGDLTRSADSEIVA